MTSPPPSSPLTRSARFRALRRLPGLSRPYGLRPLRSYTLRSRLVAGVLVLLALACAVIGVATSIALQRFMVDRVDQQLATAGGRFAASLEHEEEYGEHGDSRGQAPGTLGARLLDGRVTDAAVVSSQRGAVPPDRGGSVLSAGDAAILAAVPVDGQAHTVELPTLDDYRVRAFEGGDGDVLINGLPLEGVKSTVHRLQLAELVMFAGIMIFTGVAGTIWVRLSLRPLERVAATARRVSTLPLASGAVTLPHRVPDEDPRTEVGQVGAAFNRMLGHVEEALAERHASEQRMRTFAADASHELRTPLATVRAHVELARRNPGEVPAEVRHSLERIEAESARMGKLVDDLLLLARLDAGRPLARDQVDLTRVAIDATGDARVSSPDHKWRLELPERPVTLAGDADRLYQVVVNLLGNARAHTPPGTTVTVSVRDTGSGQAELAVSDDGPGIPEEIRSELFERFVRADKARSRASGGSGLGLAIVKAVVAAHHGSVTVDTRPGHTTLRVLLPTT
ncbi:sensor histidine kinase [Sphaerisporangium melleum]|uniref:histidine kinase n=1 Tax=Sphaerisporangium melleum TaxID=321316 RepID=A0A917QUF9_9ACTN|nr:HAMP domain-containing sensor histidine kinase [Sphaerisporangium melleum]GGK68948.1 sensor histidine kinase [Sphaerisporangium melleum]GII68953.1 sensor histidine kinase [Sphaerisporangium melleum]